MSLTVSKRTPAAKAREYEWNPSAKPRFIHYNNGCNSLAEISISYSSSRTPQKYMSTPQPLVTNMFARQLGYILRKRIEELFAESKVPLAYVRFKYLDSASTDSDETYTLIAGVAENDVQEATRLIGRYRQEWGFSRGIPRCEGPLPDLDGKDGGCPGDEQGIRFILRRQLHLRRRDGLSERSDQLLLGAKNPSRTGPVDVQPLHRRLDRSRPQPWLELRHPVRFPRHGSAAADLPECLENHFDTDCLPCQVKRYTCPLLSCREENEDKVRDRGSPDGRHCMDFRQRDEGGVQEDGRQSGPLRYDDTRWLHGSS